MKFKYSGIIRKYFNATETWNRHIISNYGMLWIVFSINWKQFVCSMIAKFMVTIEQNSSKRSKKFFDQLKSILHRVCCRFVSNRFDLANYFLRFKLFTFFEQILFFCLFVLVYKNSKSNRIWLNEKAQRHPLTTSPITTFR